MDEDRLRALQNLPNGVPGRTLRNLDQFAQDASRIPEGAAAHFTAPHSLDRPWSAPTLIGPQWLALLSHLTQGTARNAMDAPADDQGMWPQFAPRRPSPFAATQE